jgi:hypothetical protein
MAPSNLPALHFYQDRFHFQVYKHTEDDLVLVRRFTHESESESDNESDNESERATGGDAAAAAGAGEG